MRALRYNQERKRLEEYVASPSRLVPNTLRKYLPRRYIGAHCARL